MRSTAPGLLHRSSPHTLAVRGQKITLTPSRTKSRWTVCGCVPSQYLPLRLPLHMDAPVYQETMRRRVRRDEEPRKLKGRTDL
mmetsp:Transcript_5028/g.10055  ORF Transcript_5028/g.10055 Transcript_5028/m.10055 type:complete len:83 (+) Transcript_5028:395-643(+)